MSKSDLNSIKLKTLKSLKWQTINSTVSLIVNPLSLILLAYLLSPKEYGYIAILTIIISFSEKIVNMGFSHSIIQKDEVEENELNSIFWFIFLNGIIISFLILTLSGLIGNYFDTPEVSNLIKVCAIVFLFQPIGAVFLSLLKKDLEYDKLAKIQISQLFIQKIGILLLAYNGLGALSFPLSYVLGVISTLIMLSIIFRRNKKWLPKFHFSFNDLKGHYKFGMSVSANSILNNLSYYLDEIMIVSLFGVHTLGIYYFVKNIFNNMIRIVDSTVSQLMFPVFSKLKNYKEEFSAAVLKLLKTISLLIVPLSLGIASVSPLIIPVFFGEEWIESIEVFYFMGIWAILHLTSGVLTGPIYSKGEANGLLYVTLVDLPLRYFVLKIAGLSGNFLFFLLILCLLPLFKLISHLLLLKYHIDFKVNKSMYSLKGIYLSAVVSIGFSYCLVYLMPNYVNEVITLIFVVISSLILYSVFIYLFDRELFVDSMKIGKKIVGK